VTGASRFIATVPCLVGEVRQAFYKHADEEKGYGDYEIFHRVFFDSGPCLISFYNKITLPLTLKKSRKTNPLLDVLFGKYCCAE
jgi:hypothetical protein